MEEVALGAKLLSWAKAFFSNKYVLIVLGVITLAGSGYFLYQHEIKSHVATAVQQNDDKATIKSQDTTIQTTQAAAKIDQKYDQQALNTAKEYDHVRTVVVAAPTASAAADPLLIGTLNALAGVHGDANTNGVSDSPD